MSLQIAVVSVGGWRPSLLDFRLMDLAIALVLRGHLQEVAQAALENILSAAGGVEPADRTRWYHCGKRWKFWLARSEAAEQNRAPLNLL
jgi:hypothetical protein